MEQKFSEIQSEHNYFAKLVKYRVLFKFDSEVAF